MIKVVIADDELHFRKFMETVVDWETLGFTIVGIGKNGTEAIRLVHDLKPDIVFLDINMPQMSGIQMAEKLREELSEVTIIFITGYSEFEYARKALQLGVDEYILKPFSEEELLVVLNKIKLKYQKKIQEIQQSDQEKRYLQEWVWMNLIKRNNIKHGLLANQMKSAGIELKSQYCRVAVIEMDRMYEKWSDPEEMDLLRFSIVNILEESVSVKGQHYILHETDSRILSVLNIDSTEAAEEFMTKGYENVANLMRQYFSFPIRIGIGKMTDSIQKLKDSYQSALAALQSQFTRTNQWVICADDLAKEYAAAGFYRVDTNERLTLALRKGNQDEIHDILLEILEDMQKNRFSTDLTQTMLIGLLSVCLSYVTEIGGEIPEVFGEDFSPYQYIYLASSVEACFNYLEEVFQTAAVYGRQNKTTRTEEILGEILDIVQNQYQNPKLTVEGIAGMLYLHPSYIRRIFVKSMGRTLSEYIVSVRMREASRLMLEEGCSVSETGIKVGYVDPGYFSKCFKRYYNVSPSAYVKNKN